MKKLIKTCFALLLAAFALVSCQKDTELNNSAIDGKAIEFKSVISKVTDTNFEDGDKISVSSNTNQEFVKEYNVEYTYSNNLFTSSSAIYYNYYCPTSFNGIFPYTKVDSTGNYTFKVSTNQNIDGEYTNSDLLIGKAIETTSTQPTMAFKHELTRIIINVVSADVALDGATATINARCGLHGNILKNNIELDSSATTSISMAPNGVNSFKVVIPPQTITKGSLLGNVKIANTNYDIKLAVDKNFFPQTSYTYNLNISNGSVSFVTSLINGWNNDNPDINSNSAVAVLDNDFLVEHTIIYNPNPTQLDTLNCWDGVYPTEGYGTLAECGDFDPTTNTLTLSTPAQFAKFAMYTVAGDDISSYTSGYALAYCTGVTIKLGANIDLGNKPFFPLGGKFYPDGKGTARMTMGAFNGTFDGDGYEIRNLLLEPTAHDSYNTTGDKLALFYTFDNYPGFIKNLTLRGVTAVSSQALKIAAFLAYGNGGGMIRNCKLYDANIECSKFNGYAGGILAQTWSYVDIIDCHVNRDVSVTGTKYVGGIIGCMPIKGIIAYCSSAASVSSTQGYAGGIAGEFGVQSTPFRPNQTYLSGVGYPMMIGCQASGVVTSNSQSGGLVGYNGGLIAGCYSTAVMVNTNRSTPQPNGKLIGQNCEMGAKLFVPDPTKPDYIHNQPSIYGCFAPESDADSTFFCVGTIKLFDYNPAVEKYTWQQQTYPDPIAEVNNFDNSKFVSTQVTNFATPVTIPSEPRSMLYKGAISQKEVDIMNEAIALFTTSDGYLPFQTTTLENAEERASLRNYKLEPYTGIGSLSFPYKAVYKE